MCNHLRRLSINEAPINSTANDRAEPVWQHITAMSSDQDFGPNLGTIFDFTLAFDQSILNILPSSILVLATPLFLQYYRSQTQVILSSALLWSKLVSTTHKQWCFRYSRCHSNRRLPQFCLVLTWHCLYSGVSRRRAAPALVSQAPLPLLWLPFA